MVALKGLPDRIAETLEHRTVLITGGSGFLGKVLIDKILRRCTGIRTIYLLIRNKKGKTPHQRIEDIFDNPLFDELKKANLDALKKCVPIPGDVAEKNLGISPEDRKVLQDEVEFIFHLAASTRFDNSVRVAVQINTRGTKSVLDLAQECTKLKVFVHVSTAYAYPNEPVLEERAYEPPANPYEVLSALNFDAEEDMYEGLLGDCPNTYTYSKALAENLVVQQMGQVPAIVIRPSIVCPIWKEPYPGWCHNLQGPMGLFVGAGKGIIRSMYMKGDSRADFIPADVVINGMLAAPWVYLNFDKTQRFYNATSSSKYSKTWEEIIELGKEVLKYHVPFNGVVWYPGGSIKSSRFLHNLCFYLFQVVPAIFIDALLVVMGYKPILYQIQRRIQKGSEMLEYFTNKEWEFRNDKGTEAIKWMNEREKKIYKMDPEGLDLLDYFVKCMLALRRNNLKETDDMLPRARRNMKIMWTLDVVCKTVLVLTALYYLYQWVV